MAQHRQPTTPSRKTSSRTSFATLRLAPDQFPLARQVQIACDTAKLSASCLTGKAAPAQADTEKTIAELQARVRSIIALLDGFTAKDFEGAATRVVSQPRWKGEWMTGADYFVEHARPELLLPPHDGVRDPAAQRRERRQARLPGRAIEATRRGVITARPAEPAGEP